MSDQERREGQASKITNCPGCDVVIAVDTITIRGYCRECGLDYNNGGLEKARLSQLEAELSHERELRWSVGHERDAVRTELAQVFHDKGVWEETSNIHAKNMRMFQDRAEKAERERDEQRAACGQHWDRMNGAEKRAAIQWDLREKAEAELKRRDSWADPRNPDSGSNRLITEWKSRAERAEAALAASQAELKMEKIRTNEQIRDKHRILGEYESRKKDATEMIEDLRKALAQTTAALSEKGEAERAVIEALRAISTDLAQDAAEQPVEYDQRIARGYAKIYRGSILKMRQALDRLRAIERGEGKP